MKTLIINARRWFQRTYGNTYFSGELLLDGEELVNIDFQYGYGGHCTHELINKAIKEGKLPAKLVYDNGCCESNWVYFERLGYKVIENIVDVQRKKDL